tara:strand:+ start:98 stop:541 length:444 start_codon:yes stop_codon:yes gene_type:complete
MKKLLAIMVLGLLLSGNAYGEKISLECGDQSNFDRMLYVKIDKKILEIYQPSSRNRLKFKVDRMNEYEITTIGRGLDKASTSYDTYLTDWDAWDESKFIKNHIYKIGFERVQGYIGIARSNEPWTGAGKYSYQVIGEAPCKKLEKKF